jgi:hypothetical protein
MSQATRLGLYNFDKEKEMPRPPRVPDIEFKNTRIMFRNFSGVKGEYNAEGDRNFCVPLDEDIAAVLLKDGWNVRRLKPRPDQDPNEPTQAYLPVKVAYEHFPPKIMLVTSKKKNPIGEDKVGMLDGADIINVSLLVNASHWEKAGKSGIKAYAKTMYITIADDPFEEMYENVPDSAASSLFRETD